MDPFELVEYDPPDNEDGEDQDHNGELPYPLPFCVYLPLFYNVLKITLDDENGDEDDFSHDSPEESGNEDSNLDDDEEEEEEGEGNDTMEEREDFDVELATRHSVSESVTV